MSRVELTLSPVSEMARKFETQESNHAALGRRLSRLETAVAAICCLVVEHDLSGTGHRSLMELVMKPTPRRTQEKAREVLRQYLMDGPVD